MFDGVYVPGASDGRVRRGDAAARALFWSAVRRTALVAAVTFGVLVVGGSWFPQAYATLFGA